jgi:aerobic carbon-monoxide dehydrogenase large subunit
MHDVYMPTQGAAGIRAELAYVTGIPQEQLRVHAQDVGGAFGVRNEIYPEFVTILLATRSLGRPVKWTGTRAETIVSDHQGRGVTLTGELALDQDGNFLAKMEALGRSRGFSFAPKKSHDHCFDRSRLSPTACKR